ncbi:hypothetical protein IFM89_036650 [Coptis chinensis]|uniref:Uncharacterized protein n=1 Tax=Coptis chinensis TaxID=261450 RepID=A0A835IGP8_9MAGN|nr:hypothetical protein IFM89_036650 [Coptis chinensis]
MKPKTSALLDYLANRYHVPNNHTIGRPKPAGTFGDMKEDMARIKIISMGTLAILENKYLEEVEKCSTPGSVAMKKAYFEAHYKNIAAQKVEIMEEEQRMGEDLFRSDTPCKENSINNDYGTEVEFGTLGGVEEEGDDLPDGPKSSEFEGAVWVSDENQYVEPQAQLEVEFNLTNEDRSYVGFLVQSRTYGCFSTRKPSN